MKLAINSHKLQGVNNVPFVVPSPNELRRQGAVFFIGANLPVLETLETMYESYCQESSELFYVTFTGREELHANLELVRQIKKNFSVRLMGRINFPLPEAYFEQLYLAGLDLLDIPLHVLTGRLQPPAHDTFAFLGKAAAAFPRWSLTSSLQSDEMDMPALRSAIDRLLDNGIVPFVTLPVVAAEKVRDSATAIFAYLADSWHRRHVPIKPLLPLIRLTTPLELFEPRGFLRNAIGRLHDRKQLATSDLRRHLRTSGAEASFESAGL